MGVIAKPAASFAVPGAGKSVEPNGRDRIEHAASSHQIEPVRIERGWTAQHRFPAAALSPMSSGANHFAEQQPARIFPPVPVEQVVGFVPKLDVPKMVAIAR